MSETVRLEVTFTCADARALLRSAVSAGLLPAEPPSSARSGEEPMAVSPGDWIGALQPAKDTPLTVMFAGGAVARLDGAERVEIAAPGFSLDVEELTRTLSRMPFDVATFAPVHAWDGYPPPVTKNGAQARLGFGIAFHGAGHARLISRRWLDRGPWRVLREDNDTTFVQLHDLRADDAASLAQARASHGMMCDPDQEPLPLADDFQGGSVAIQGKYLPAERRVVVTASGRPVTRAEMHGAAAARTFQILGAMLPVENIVYAFGDMTELERALPDLWLYGLEARHKDEQGLHRKDDGYTPPAYDKPAWVRALGRDDRAAHDEPPARSQGDVTVSGSRR